MADVSDFQLDEDGDPVASLLLPTGKTVVLRWIDDEDEDLPSEQALRDLTDDALDGLTAEQIEAVEEESVRELTESAFDEDEREIEEEDYRKLAGDMDLVGVTVFTDGTVTLEYVAPHEYPDLAILVQLDEEFGVEDLLVE